MTAQTAALPRDSDLIADSRTEPEAFAVLFDRYAGMLYRYVSRRVGPEIAEDLVGETFLAAFAGRSGYDLSYADARPWLFGIVTNLISRHRRTEAAHYRALQRSPIEDVAHSDDDRIAAGVTARAARPLLARALAGLAPKDRNVLLLVAWSDLSYEEVAQALGVPIGTVRSRLNRARRKVRSVLGDSNPMREEN
ncbi:RNA polymerase sigma factor [Planotetraspora kaengkrachanensis]|uniref:DNA-directed RNA polymerase sigma-70 factor n=1 Tax=Planotetraspora kaengkrachanensis TaxID=575193 RepID=A0A8J3V8P7_9ACTN|nr:RNA polymerase sigma factor [Planotetraspora kaengkrachanensis]GIG82211.1 DNA-directed RNA polymerase sigma-70 factor [Planotetraspora kaengkrachanensis]